MQDIVRWMPPTLCVAMRNAEHGRHRRNLHEGGDPAAKRDVGINVIDRLFLQKGIEALRHLALFPGQQRNAAVAFQSHPAI